MAGGRAGFRIFLLFGLSVYYIFLYFLNRLALWRPPRKSVWYSHLWARSIERFLGLEVEVSGKEPPPGSLIVSNHRSYIDVIPVLGRVPCSFLAKAEVRSWPIIGYGASLAGVAFVDRSSARSRRASLGRIEQILASGVSMAIYPEGTTSAGPGVLPFKKRAFEIAERFGSGVAPMAVSYEDPACAWVGEDSFIRHFLEIFGKKRNKVFVRFGPVLEAGAEADVGEAARRWIIEALDE